MNILTRLFRLFKSQSDTEPAQHPDPAQTINRHTFRIEAERDRPSYGATRHAGQIAWVSSKQTKQLAGFNIGKWVYWGTSSLEPSLIDPSLPVREGTSTELGYYPSYARLSPAQRYTYLHWLSHGRNAQGIDIGYVFLFFYGIERRILTHVLKEPMSNETVTELRELTAEIERLQHLYADQSGSFRGYSTSLLNIVNYSIGSQHRISHFELPSLDDHQYDVPMSLRAAIGKFSLEQIPLPAEWALRWAWYFPETRIRTPARRLSKSLEQLFILRYNELFGDGMVVQPSKRFFETGFFPANSTLRNVTVPLSTIPNTFELKRPARVLMKIFDEVTDELDPHSRWLGRNKNNASQLVGLATVPHEILGHYSASIESLDTWLQQTITSERAVVIDANMVLERLPLPPNENLSKSESAALAHVLGALGVGVEPDTRLAGASIKANEKIALFRTSRPTPMPSSSAFDFATVILHLAAAVGSADGTVSPEEIDTLSHHLRSNLEYTKEEEARLYAHLLWLAHSEINLTGMKRRLTNLESGQRKAIGDLLIDVAVSDVSLLPSEVSTLKQIFRLLDLDVERVHSLLHTAMTSDRLKQKDEVDTPMENALRLDPIALQRKQEETIAVSKLLAEIFEEEVESPQPPPEPPPDGAVELSFDDLDTPHATLLIQLIQQEHWSSADFESRCAELHLIPLGAIDVINDYSIDSVDDVIIEVAANGITINPEVREELFQ